MSLTEMSEEQDLESVTAKILERISSEAAYRTTLYKILAYCETIRSSAEVEQEVRSFPEMRTALQSPQILLLWLVQAGGIEPVAAATEEESPRWRTTPAGQHVVQIENPGNRLTRQLAQEPAYHEVYRLVLQACLAPKSRSEIEALLRDHPALENPKIYASFFIDALEQAGGIEWDEKWRTTQAGKEFVAGGDSSGAGASNLHS